MHILHLHHPNLIKDILGARFALVIVILLRQELYYLIHTYVVHV